ncbi:hypothetical protein AVEN_268836-1 [Araneus ventricosus]|uniref:Uncharacterized protein n=1 Tax=Araneus ventricosus TaxID=182803 RepID=A0A4Y2LD42_ARAVE|nr:hypothetical protein AVEN_268836-1 [Araneus ventricosus]
MPGVRRNEEEVKISWGAWFTEKIGEGRGVGDVWLTSVVNDCCGLFESGDEDLELAFRYAVDHVNADTSVLPTSRLQAHVERVEKHDSFTASKKEKESDALPSLNEILRYDHYSFQPAYVPP